MSRGVSNNIRDRRVKTTLSHPLHIATVSPPGFTGLTGLTLCSGKKERGRDWDRDLDIDVDAVRKWGAEIVVSLVEQHEIEFLDVPGFPRCRRASRDEMGSSANPRCLGTGRKIRGAVGYGRARIAGVPAARRFDFSSLSRRARPNRDDCGAPARRIGMDAHDAIVAFCGRYGSLRYPNQLLKGDHKYAAISHPDRLPAFW
jgi:hypothetical protein